MRPFELVQDQLEPHIEEMVTVTIADLSSEFLLMPTGNGFTKYHEFQSAYEVLKRQTGCFSKLSLETVQAALLENSLVLGVLRSILGLPLPNGLNSQKLNSKVTSRKALPGTSIRIAERPITI